MKILARPLAATNAGLCPAPREDLRPRAHVGENAERALTIGKTRAGCAGGLDAKSSEAPNAGRIQASGDAADSPAPPAMQCLEAMRNRLLVNGWAT